MDSAHDEFVEEMESLDDHTRLVVMVELEPLSDKYVQVMLDQGTFKQISELAFEAQPASKTALGTRRIRVNLDPVTIPDVQECYSQEELKEADEGATMQ